MLNKDNERELAYVVAIDDIKPIPGKDRVECAVVGGWTIMVRKDQFKPGDLGIYFEIDSKVPQVEPFLFLEKKHFAIKTQKYKAGDGHFWSQGLLMSAEDFCGETYTGEDGVQYIHINEWGDIHDKSFKEGEFLTKLLGVTYAIANDNRRKRATRDKYKEMARRQGKRFSKQPYKWLMNRLWGKKLLFVFFGKKRDKNRWPEWVVKTDEERIQNMPWILEDKEMWIVTEKIDGTSTTFTMKRKRFGCYDFYVCSRNVMFDCPNIPCYYDANVYLEMAKMYDIENKMKSLMENECSDCEWITIQGETYGEGIQKRDYSCDGHLFAAFNFITSKDGRYNSLDMQDILQTKHGIPCVPIMRTDYILPDTIEKVIEFATGDSVLDAKPREGFVFRSLDGERSFKAVSNEYLMKYHG